MDRYEFALELANKLAPHQEMLEIGVNHGDMWHHMRGHVLNYTGVDITMERVSCSRDDTRSHWYEMDSRKFWELMEQGLPEYLEGRKWNLIFVDGDHEYEYVVVDIREGLKHLENGGYMFVHDCIEIGAVRTAFEEICQETSGIEYYTVPEDVNPLGLGVIHKLKEVE